MSAAKPAGVHYVFPHDYEVKSLASYSLVNPLETLHQFPAELEEGDRTGLYLRITRGAKAWIGFFALGFDSGEVANGIYSCPDPDSFCAVVGGYAYVVSAGDPGRSMQIELRPVLQVRPVPELKRLLFVGFTSIAGLGESNSLWTTQRLSWEGLSIDRIQGTTLYGAGWDMFTDKEVAFEVDLLTGKSIGGAQPRTT